jgi:glycosyltransferase involved in cell wall biosynthesis
MPKLVTAILCKNEADKYLERVLRRCLEFSDEVLVLDDGSTDDSDRIAWRLGCQVKPWTGQTMWGAEAAPRAALWEWGAQEAGDGWLLIADADMLLQGDPRPLLNTTVHNAWAFVLYDLWDSETTFRCDGYWQGHAHPRPWLFRPCMMQCDPSIWPERGIHTGHFPQNAVIDAGIADSDQLSWMHLAYLTFPARLRKREQYLAKSHLLTPFERAHADSVGD